ncbi:MAG: DNA-packaging protein [Oscillospiraceae bacterium]|nr:DNA-packaging protein [Oscillospiraceae bacterium]
MVVRKNPDTELEIRIGKYFREREEEPTSLADLCAYLGISLEEWTEYKENAGKKLVCARAETKLLSLLEKDKYRAASIITQMMKDYRQDIDSGVKLEFVLNGSSRETSEQS